MKPTVGRDAPVVVVGAGLAGLAAATSAARAGSRVVLLDVRAPGGRARTDVRDGFRLNQGPHALFRRGAGWRVLARLGVQPRGHTPPLAGLRGLAEGQILPMWNGKLLPARSKARVVRVLAAVARGRTSAGAGVSCRHWIDSLDLDEASTRFIEAGVRVSSYVSDLERMPAELAVGQLRGALLNNVLYLDGGWEQLTGALRSSATEAGVDIRDHSAVAELNCDAGRWEVTTREGRALPARTVVLAVGSPKAAAGLLAGETGWEDLGPEVTATCLDLGARGSGASFVLGLDRPLYFQRHSPPGDLAPAGSALIHVMRYGSRGSEADRAELSDFAGRAGIEPGDVVVERFLHRMVVCSCLPPAASGIAGRPPVAVVSRPGLFLAGDWVGSQGWLADASLASGEAAGVAAATWTVAAAPSSRATADIR